VQIQGRQEVYFLNNNSHGYWLSHHLVLYHFGSLDNPWKKGSRIFFHHLWRL